MWRIGILQLYIDKSFIQTRAYRIHIVCKNTSSNTLRWSWLGTMKESESGNDTVLGQDDSYKSPASLPTRLEIHSKAQVVSQTDSYQKAILSRSHTNSRCHESLADLITLNIIHRQARVLKYYLGRIIPFSLTDLPKPTRTPNSVVIPKILKTRVSRTKMSL